jgi:ornithine carbamoyltransferase
MGQEDEEGKRKSIFKKYQINRELMKKAKGDAIILHCLPAHRGEEITDEMMESPQSVVFDQAENRLHMQKALLEMLMK